MTHAPRRLFCRHLIAALIAPALLPAGKQALAALAPTPADAEGPFYKPGAPERASLIEAGMSGTDLIISGRVLAADGKPLAGAKLDFWHTDAHGNYDNRGFRLRGYQRTDANGRYRLETIVPGAYPGRTRHVHVKVEAPGRRPLTTQLYFPDEPRNRTDSLYNTALAMEVRDRAGGKEARFDFVLK